MPTIALSTGSLYTYGLARVFALAAEAGFDAIEILVDHRWDSRQPAYLRRLSAEAGLPIAVVHNPFKPFVPGWPHDSLGRLRESVAVAHEVGAPVVVAHLPLRIGGARLEFFGLRRGPALLPLPLGGEKAYRDFLLNGLASFEAEQGIKIGVENMPAKRALGRALDIHWLNDLETLGQMPHLTLDTTHVGTWGLDLLAVYEQLKARIVHVHLSDFDGNEHRLPGSGHLPLGGLLQRLVRDGYEGAVTLELGPEVLEAEDESRVRTHLRRVVQFCRSHMSEDLGRQTANDS
ncbi:MAG: sugar phosphate isomerase/epimerase [Anaerolineae bacterium]